MEIVFCRGVGTDILKMHSKNMLNANFTREICRYNSQYMENEEQFTNPL